MLNKSSSECVGLELKGIKKREEMYTSHRHLDILHIFFYVLSVVILYLFVSLPFNCNVSSYIFELKLNQGNGRPRLNASMQLRASCGERRSRVKKPCDISAKLKSSTRKRTCEHTHCLSECFFSINSPNRQ